MIIDKVENKVTVDEALKAITIKTDKVATIEDMNESIANAFKNWDDNSEDEECDDNNEN